MMERIGARGPTHGVLFPSSADRRRWDDLLTGALAAAHQEVVTGSVTPTFDPTAFNRALDAFDFRTPRVFDDIALWTIAQLQHGVVHTTHPRYFGLFNPAPTFPAQAAERITATFNPQLASTVTSPAATAIEAHVLKAIAARAGLPPHSAGHFTSGGSEANCTALICALTRATPDFAEHGARAFAGPPTFYVSRESHIAWLKISHQVGIGRAAARMVATDGTGRMDVAALTRMIEGDRAAGKVPVMIAATAGTTNAGVIDPLAACAGIADRCGLWFHVDAAWAGALIMSERLRGALAGIELATSVTIDAHKWLATTMACGMFITRHPAVLHEAFHVAASFMPPNADQVDPYVSSMQWSRRFLGLRLFMTLATVGWAGYAELVETSVALASRIGDELEARGWRVLNRSQVAVLCLEPPPQLGTPRSIVNRVVASGQAWVSVALFEGREVVRACVTHGETNAADVAALIAVLNGGMNVDPVNHLYPNRENRRRGNHQESPTADR
jgi:glutamate/tyrosine decarboxylase-like PLP-dependent enzyme